MPGWPKELAPGETGSFIVKFNTKGKRGRQTKSITVQTNDPKNPRFVYKLVGEIFQPVEISPASISIRTKLGEIVTKTATIKNNTQSPIVLGELQYPDETTSEMMTASLSTQQLAPGESAEFSLTFKAATEGRTFKNFSITTDSKVAQKLSIRVSGYVEDPSKKPAGNNVPIPSKKPKKPPVKPAAQPEIDHSGHEHSKHTPAVEPSTVKKVEPSESPSKN